MENFNYMSAMRKYATFSGRAPRKEYWMYTLVYLIIGIIAAIIDAFVFGLAEGSLGIFGLIVGLVHLLPSISVGVRRLHDINRSGWWYLIIFLPIIGFLLLLYWMIKSSDEGDNHYGPNPYGMTDTSVFQ